MSPENSPSTAHPGWTPTVIEDAGDPRLADFRDLISADSAGVKGPIVIAEGVSVVERLLRSGLAVRAVAGVSSKLTALRSVLAATTTPVYEVDKWVLSEVVGFRVTRGVLASVLRPPPHQVSEVLAAGARFVVLETINDFENLGAIFRNAAAFGIDGVLLNDQCADPWYRRSVRVSMGHVFAVPSAVLPSPWPASLSLLRDRGIEILALTPAADAVRLGAVRPSRRWAVMLGAEGPGLTAGALAAADLSVRIPMSAGVDSLNVATAGAVAFAQLTT